MNLGGIKGLRAKRNALVNPRQEAALEVIDWLIAEVERLQLALSDARAAALREAAEVAREYARNEDNLTMPVMDGHQHAKYLGLRIAAAILARISAGEGVCKPISIKEG